MIDLLYIHYDADTGFIKGLYTKDRHAYIPKPFLNVDVETRNRVLENPKLYMVYEGQVIERSEYKPEFSRESLELQAQKDTAGALSESTRVGKYYYNFDQTLQQNIILGYIATQGPLSTVKLWCRDSDGEWLFKSHTKRELSELCAAFNSIREDASVAYHEKLNSLDEADQ